MVPSGSLNCLAGKLDGDQDALSLQPFRSQAILVIGPFPLGNDAQRRGLENDCSKPEFVEGQHPAHSGAPGRRQWRLPRLARYDIVVFMDGLERSKSFSHAQPSKSTCAISSSTLS